MRRFLLLTGLGVMGLAFAPAQAALTANQVLVVYNSQNTDSAAVYNYYASAHPGVLGLDLNDSSLSAGNISYANYQTQIADKVKTYLTANNNLYASQVADITLTMGIPTRVQDQDLSNPNYGDGQDTTKVTNGTATYSTVDSELTMVLQNTHAGTPSASMGTLSSNFVTNPYYGSTSSITSYNRSNITQAASFTQTSSDGVPYWQMNSSAGNIYLTTRLDGYTLADVKAMIDRGKTPIQYNQNTDKIIIDSNGTDNYDNGTYAATASHLSGKYAAVVNNASATFLIGQSGSVPDPNAARVAGNIAALISYGGNHSFNDQSGYVDTYKGQLVRGAIMDTLESYNAKDFGGLGGFQDQGQLAEFIADGGTLGVGNAWEPFTFSVNNPDIMIQDFMLNGMTWAEAAWASLPYLSWQQLVIGDPLATATVVPEPTTVSFLLIGGGLLLRRRRQRD